MPVREMEPRWRQRLEQIESRVDEVRLPQGAQDLSQDAEWCEAVIAGQPQRFRLHDYDEIYRVPGLYEELFYHKLECCSPTRTANLLVDLLADSGEDLSDCVVMDLGAGNGMVADELYCRGAREIVGVDIIREAKEAALRDRPELYRDYLVADLTDLTEQQEARLRRYQFNCLTTVAALGFGDIPPLAFTKALDLIATPGWIAATIKEDFLHEEDTSGFSRLVRAMSRERVIQIQSYRRFQHRVSIAGEPLYYVAMVARKLTEIPDWLFERDATY